MGTQTGDAVNVALVGAGRQGMRRLQAIQDLAEDEVVIVADLDDDAARALARRAGCRWTSDWHEALEAEADAVVICVPPDAHAGITLQALRTGRHVLCEKPLAMTAATAWSLVAEAERAGRILKCGFNYRHHAAIVQARAWVTEGRLGSVALLRGRHGTGGRPNFEREWRTQLDRSGGGVLMDQGVHVLDLFQWFGTPFTQVVACTVTCYWPVAPVEDNAFAILRGNDLLANLHVSWTQWKNLFSLDIIGSHGSISVEGLGGSYGVERVVYRPQVTGVFQEQDVIEFRGPDLSWHGEWREFKTAIGLEREPSGSGRDGAEALALAEAIYESARVGRTVHLDDRALPVARSARGNAT